MSAVRLHPLSCACLLAALSAVAVAQDPALPQGLPKVRTSVGIEGQFLLRHAHGRLRARPVVARSPVLLRIADVEKVAEAAGDVYVYDIRYIGEVPGVYDLRDWLIRPDGQALTNVEPIPVQVVSALPVEHAGEIHEIPKPAAPAVGGYRLLLWGLGILWALPIVWWLGRRLLRRRDATSAAAAAGPQTLADQLRPLVEAAGRGELDVRERGRLELMLLGFWRHRLGLTDLDAPRALAAMRDQGEAGRLLRALEDWLHRPPGSVTVDVEELLEPYSSVAAGELPDLPASLGKVIERADDEDLFGERSA